MAPFFTRLNPPKKPRAVHGAAQIGGFLDDIVKPALASRGISEANLVAHWPAIVGDQVAAFAQPEQLQWPMRGDKRDPFGPSAPATLVLRIDGAFALEASHLAPTIVNRVNAHLGWRCVARLAFRQGPLAPRRPARQAKAPPSAAALERARQIGAGIDDENLREALVRLGARILDKRQGKG